MRRLPALMMVLLVACSGEEPRTRRTEKETPPLDCVSEWKSVAPGADYRMLGCDPGARRFDLHLVRIDPKVFRLDAVSGAGTTAPDLGREWPFAVNANFFDEQYRPLGVVVSGGKNLNREHRVSWQSIFLVTKDGEPHIVRTADWPAWRDRAQMAVQAGPRLIVDGAKNEVARADPSWRSGVCVADGKAIFFATPPESLFDVWQMIDHTAGLGCDEAMLFDGGPSTQLFLRGAVSLEGDKRVPAYVVGGR